MISLDLFNLLVLFTAIAGLLFLLYVAITATYWRGQ